MIFAVTTHSFLAVVEVDSAWQLIGYKVLDTGYHYGVAVIEEESESSPERSEGQFIVYRGGESVSEQNDARLMRYRQIGNSFEAVGSIPFAGEAGDVHQIAYANGGLYIANTKYNTLLFQSLEGDKRQEYVFENVRTDVNHINSVYPCGGQVYVVLHNQRRRQSELALLQHDFSNGLTLRQRLSLWHENCHNVFFDESYLYYNASLAKRLVVVDLERERVSKKLSFAGIASDMPDNSGHVKGISATKDHLVVGVSEHTTRDKRPTSKGYLAIVNRHSLSTLAVIDLNLPDLPHPIGNINEVRCLSGGELAQSRSASANVHWSGIELARGNPLVFYAGRIKGRLLTPVLQVKRRLTG
jgi:hypothetical protein